MRANIRKLGVEFDTDDDRNELLPALARVAFAVQGKEGHSEEPSLRDLGTLCDELREFEKPTNNDRKPRFLSAIAVEQALRLPRWVPSELNAEVEYLCLSSSAISSYLSEIYLAQAQQVTADQSFIEAA